MIIGVVRKKKFQLIRSECRTLSFNSSIPFSFFSCMVVKTYRLCSRSSNRENVCLICLTSFETEEAIASSASAVATALFKVRIKTKISPFWMNIYGWCIGQRAVVNLSEVWKGLRLIKFSEIVKCLSLAKWEPNLFKVGLTPPPENRLRARAVLI